MQYHRRYDQVELLRQIRDHIFENIPPHAERVEENDHIFIFFSEFMNSHITASPSYASIRSVMLYTLIPIVERLCKVAEAAGVMIPSAPNRISRELSVMITL